MRRETFNCERAGDAGFGFVFVRFVVEKLELGFGGNRRVELFLAGEASLPPCLVELRGCFGPRIYRLFGQRLGGVRTPEAVVQRVKALSDSCGVAVLALAISALRIEKIS